MIEAKVTQHASSFRIVNILICRWYFGKLLPQLHNNVKSIFRAYK